MTFAGKAIALWAVAATAVFSFALPDDAGEPPRPSATFAAPAESTSPSEPDVGIVEPQAGRRSWRKATCALPRDQLQRTLRGYFRGRSPEITFVPTEPHFFGNFKTTTTHSGPWDYVQEVPLVLYGPGFIRPEGDLTVDREVTVADLAPTFARLLGTNFPGARPGRALTESLVPKALRPGKPRLIMTVVWDGGGWNTLNEWPNTWPNLAKLIAGGTSVQNVVVGSNPSVTPAIHANMGTGAFPNRHGIVSIPQRRSGRIEDSWSGHSPHNLEIKTLADMYDPRTRNRAKIGMLAEQDWHLGMIGHGAAIRGGDRDIAVLTRTSPFETNTRYYRLPEYLQSVPGFRADVRTIDKSDGNRNNKWLGHRLPKNRSEGFANPAWSLYQIRLLRALLNRERFGRDLVPDLFYTNFKQIDEVSHAYFLQSPEMKGTIPYSDQALGALVRWMNKNVGKKKWVLAVTADHGVGPKFTEIGAWPINIEELQIDVAIRFRMRITELFDSQRPQGFWVDRAALRRAGVTRAEIADFLVNYRIRDNVRDGQRIPEGYRAILDHRLFSAAWPTEAITRMSQCKRGNA
jgi:hypothetical protein